MIRIEDSQLQSRVNHLFSIGQGHIFRFWAKLDSRQQKNLLDQVDQIDTDLLGHLIEIGLNPDKYAHGKQELKPAEVISLNERGQKDPGARIVGEQTLRDGKVGAFLVAGGQGTRLGISIPKGMYPVTPVMRKSLFQLHAEKLLATGRKYGVDIPWYIMTSRTNHAETVKYFQDNRYFGYQTDNILLFMQDMIPAIDLQGKLILDAPDHIFMNPNGHGGSLKALWQSGSIADMKKRGIEYIFYFQVDNVLTRICDPEYIGYHIQKNAEMSNKVVRKVSPEEKLGVICYIDGQSGVVEYSDLGKEESNAMNPDGSLVFWAGSIATHMLSVDFVERENKEGFKLPYHIAHKNIPYLDDAGKLIQPREKNGIKFETFVFDALLDAKRVVSIEVERDKEFSPLKNESGENSPETVRQSLVETYAGWLEQAGQKVKGQKGKQGIEISPLFALDAEELKQREFKFDPQADEIYLGP